jgi:hypothetical protein
MTIQLQGEGRFRSRLMLVELNCRSLGFARDDKGEISTFLCISCWTSEQQVPPLRFAPVGMTIQLQGEGCFRSRLMLVEFTLHAALEIVGKKTMK